MSANSDAILYANSMSRIRERVGLIEKVFTDAIDVGSEAFRAEIIFLHFRKILEEIAFSSLVANKEKYSELNAKFAEHWKAERILETVKQINPDFYPVPLEAPTWNGRVRHFELIGSGFLTMEDFTVLYQASSEVLHTWNPYKEGDPTIQVKYTVPEWISRIQCLLSWHQVTLLEGGAWVVNIPAVGPVHTYPTRPID
jgi:hypothetical protein